MSYSRLRRPRPFHVLVLRRNRRRFDRSWRSLGFALIVALSACAGKDADIETEVADLYENFPSVAQPLGTHSWPQGRFTGECRRASNGLESYACLYADEKGGRGFVCFNRLTELKIETASGPYDSRRWTDHGGLPLPAEGAC